MMVIIFHMNIDGSVALVTGANRGLGLAFAKALLARGAKKVYAAARDPKSVTLPGVIPIRLDVTDEASVARLAELEDITVLINNAGVSRGHGALQRDALARAREEMEANYFGPLATANVLAPILAKNGGGAIVNVLSALSWAAFPTTTTYSGSKAAAWGLSNGLRHELRGQSTNVVALHVGYIDTDMAAHVNSPKAKPDDVVKAALDAVEANAPEAFGDDLSKVVKANLSNGVYLQPPGGAAF
jgi:NAD(P)-dependent dehydrogenase (short-subunit alcohol dehydrogenase family)